MYCSKALTHIQREAILEHQKYDAHEEVIEVQLHARMNIHSAELIFITFAQNSLPVAPGHYILHWDNTFSRFRKKQLTYSVIVTSPKSDRKELVVDSEVNTNAAETEKKD